MSANDAPIEQAAAALRGARRIVILTGAGISAESGVPTFRAAQTGLWARYDPLELATPEAFRRDPGLVWDWYAWRRELIGAARPNAGHLALARLERAHPDVLLVTQNVDGLHQQAGSERLVELHGNLRRNRCSREGTLLDADPGPGRPPACPGCGAPLRPDVVWFGEMLPAEALERAATAAADCDLFLSVGTSTVVEPAASLPFAALRGGATVIELNPEPTPLTAGASHVLKGAAAALLPGLVEHAFGERT